LAVRVHRLWNEAGGDVARACDEFDRLVVEFGRWQVARAMSDAGLPDVENEPARPRQIIGVETS
jgi:hypothetical protein